MRLACILIVLIAGTGCSTAPPAGPSTDSATIRPSHATQPVTADADDPAIWNHPSDPQRSLILGTNKVKAPDGAVAVFRMDGTTLQTFSGLDRPNNVDVEYGLPLGGRNIDIAVATERLRNQLRVFEVRADGSGISDITSSGKTLVFAGRSGEQAAPMGISLYRRPKDGAIFAIVAPKEGPRTGYLGQYRLEDDGHGRVKASFVRYFGNFSGIAEIEAVAVDDALGYVFYSDEGDGIHKYHADPDHPAAATELAHFGKTGFKADREGIAIYARDNGTGYIVCTDQLALNSEYHVYAREGEPGNPHDHNRLLKIVKGGADTTDGIEITSRPAGGFPAGFLAAMNSKDRNFLLFSWTEIAEAGPVKLKSAR